MIALDVNLQLLGQLLLHLGLQLVGHAEVLRYRLDIIAFLYTQFSSSCRSYFDIKRDQNIFAFRLFSIIRFYYKTWRLNILEFRSLVSISTCFSLKFFIKLFFLDLLISLPIHVLRKAFGHHLLAFVRNYCVK